MNEYNLRNCGAPSEKLEEIAEYASEAAEFVDAAEVTAIDFSEYNYRHDTEYSEEEEDDSEEEDEEDEEEEEEDEAEESAGNSTRSLRSVFESVSVVAVTAVAVVLADAPILDVTQFDVGYESVEYCVDVVNETGSNIIISIGNSGFEYEVEVSDGVVGEFVEGLTPNTKYTFEVRGADTLERTYLSREFRTARDPTEYDARVTDMNIVREDGNMFACSFTLLDPYNYYSGYVLSVTDSGGHTVDEAVGDAEIRSGQPVRLELAGDGPHLIKLSCKTSKPSDAADGVAEKTLYSAELS